MSQDEITPLQPPRLDWSQRRFSHCQATEDACSYEHCPRWRDGKLISEEHCALGLIDRDEDAGASAILGEPDMAPRQRPDQAAGRVLPKKFTLTIEEDPIIGWVVTSDAHKGFMQVIMPEEGLPEGLRQVPAALREILVAQMDADRKRGGADGAGQ